MTVFRELVRRTLSSLKRGLSASGSGIDTYVFGVNGFRTQMRCWFPDRRLVFVSSPVPQEFLETLVGASPARRKAEFMVWGSEAMSSVLGFATTHDIAVWHLESGFLPPVFGATGKATPYTACIDSRAPYFDSTRSTDLEILLESYDFAANPGVTARADELLQMAVAKGISRFNDYLVTESGHALEAKTSRRILVISQPEDDRTVLAGCSDPVSVDEMVRLATTENAGGEILIWRQPVANRDHRMVHSASGIEVAGAKTLSKGIPLARVLSEVDRVYTLTSLAGFEAAVRGIEVTTLGCPFYASWGITDDRQPNQRRTRKLSPTEIFSVVYLEYAKYFEQDSGDPVTPESAFNKVVALQRADKPSPGSGQLASASERPFPVVPSASDRSSPVRVPGINSPARSAVAKRAGKAADIVTPDGTAARLRTGIDSGEAAVTATSVKLPPKLPDWFQADPGVELTRALAESRPVFLYIPWIAEHGNSLIARLGSANDYTIAALDLTKGVDEIRSRREVALFARQHPDIYRRLVVRRLVPLRKRIAGVIFTFDWAPAMRLVSTVCEELSIARILIPHESVFVDRQKYYWDPTAKASVPTADIILGWGELQRDIFVERGYEDSRIALVGAPKFDPYVNYSPQLTRLQFHKLFSLNEKRKTILFASQPLDSQLDASTARQSQRDAVADLLDLAASKQLQLLVRLPPSKDDVLGPELRGRLEASPNAAVDDALCYLVSPEEAIYHADIVTSINSTMLFEALLLGRPTFSLKYTAFEQFWDQAGIPSVHDKGELTRHLESILAGAWSPPPDGMVWAARMFSNGQFDGGAHLRIKERLSRIARGEEQLKLRPTAIERLLSHDDGGIDVIAIPSTEDVWGGVQKHLLPMLRSRTRVNSSHGVSKLGELASADLFVQWGIASNAAKSRQREAAQALGRPILIVEDGFIRSVDIGLSGEPGLSIILDDTTAYYDATQVSRLQRLFEDGPDLTPEQLDRSRDAIEKIKRLRVSKYNHAPNHALSIGAPDRKKVLLVDQRYGDQSVRSGLADESSFERMLQDVLVVHAAEDILIKQHPDAIKGGKSSYYNDKRMAFARYMDNVHVINFDINPYALLELVDEVYVVTSGMGFEALMAGKVVHCYGIPFYAGWGVTQDKVTTTGRSRRRSVEELFYFSYIESSRYYDPKRASVVEVEDMVDYIVAKRGW